jgi:transcriptional regulator with XRE-family HTH domain
VAYSAALFIMKPVEIDGDQIELKKIAQRLKELRKTKGFASYEHIAYELGMSRSAYWRIESGKNFEIKTLIKICKVLGVTLSEFFEGIQ